MLFLRLRQRKRSLLRSDFVVVVIVSAIWLRLPVVLPYRSVLTSEVTIVYIYRNYAIDSRP